MKVELQNFVADLKEFYSCEKDLYQIWINFCNSKYKLNEIGLCGIESGMLNEQEGPDFQGAELDLLGKIYRGDVEIHKKCSDWYKHGHHLDPGFDKVVLHLVMEKSVKAVINSKNQYIPSISMSNFPDTLSHENCSNNCDVGSLNFPIPKTMLINLALKRMLIKTKELEQLVATYGIDQALYLSILKCLGSGINKNNYLTIAQIIPWRLIHYLLAQNKSFEFWLALFLGSAGLINNTNNELVHKNWNQCQPLIEGHSINASRWRLGGLRPYNFPQNRLAGLAQFIWQLEDHSIYLLLKRIIYKRLKTAELLNKMYNLFNRNTQNISKSIFNRQHNFWGRNLLIELMGNVVIPIFITIAKNQNSCGFESYLKEIFLKLPATQNYGKLKYLRNKIKSNLSDTNLFYSNQALLHLQNSYCLFNNFKHCPLKTINQKN